MEIEPFPMQTTCFTPWSGIAFRPLAECTTSELSRRLSRVSRGMTTTSISSLRRPRPSRARNNCIADRVVCGAPAALARAARPAPAGQPRAVRRARTPSTNKWCSLDRHTLGLQHPTVRLSLQSCTRHRREPDEPPPWVPRAHPSARLRDVARSRCRRARFPSRAEHGPAFSPCREGPNLAAPWHSEQRASPRPSEATPGVCTRRRAESRDRGDQAPPRSLAESQPSPRFP